MTTLRKHCVEIILVGSIICMGAVFLASLEQARADHEQMSVTTAWHWELEGTKP